MLMFRVQPPPVRTNMNMWKRTAYILQSLTYCQDQNGTLLHRLTYCQDTTYMYILSLTRVLPHEVHGIP